MTLLLLGDVLEGLGITWGVFGHTTEGSHVGHSRYNAAPIEAQKKFARFGALRIEWVKGFTESWRPKRRLIAALHPQNNTYDAEVLRYSAKQLLNVRVARRIIFMFDDGHPEPNIDSHQPIHQRELIKAVREVTSGGVEVLGVGMGHSAIGNYYPRHVHITELNKLPEVLLKVLGEMLAQWKRAV